MRNKINKQKACPPSRKIFGSRRGFTIIETMISISIFLIIVTTGMGALLNANLLHQKSQSMRSIIDNLSFIMEDMGGNLRTGYSYRCYDSGDSTITIVNVSSPTTKSCANGWAISFEAAGGNPSIDTDQWVYYIGSTGKFDKDGNVINGIFKSTNGATSFVQLTPDEVVISPGFGFSVLGAESPVSGDHQQPFVTIRLIGKITFKNVVTPFSLQTSVSQRVIDRGL